MQKYQYWIAKQAIFPVGDMSYIDFIESWIRLYLTPHFNSAISKET